MREVIAEPNAVYEPGVERYFTDLKLDTANCGNLLLDSSVSPETVNDLNVQFRVNPPEDWGRISKCYWQWRVFGQYNPQDNRIDINVPGIRTYSSELSDVNREINKSLLYNLGQLVNHNSGEQVEVKQEKKRLLR